MIVRLCNTDLLKLANGEPLTLMRAVGDPLVIVPDSEAEHAEIVENTGPPTPVAASSAKGGERRGPSPARRRKKTGQRWMQSLYGGSCYIAGCRTAILKGDWIVYDYDQGKALCAGHGEQNFPNLKKPEEVSAR